MHQDIATALRLQSLDLRIAELRREIAALPKEIAQIEKTLDSHVKRLELDKTALAANLRERKRIEGDIQVHEQKRSRLRDQMQGKITNEQYRAFQHEIAYCDESVRKCEDHILELMIEAENLEKNVATAEAALAEEKEVVEARKVEARLRTADDKAELAQDEATRASCASALPPALLASYDRLRTRYYKDGDVIAQAKDGMCLSCMMAMRPQHFQDVKAGAEVLFCENCRRILYFEEPPADIASEMAP